MKDKIGKFGLLIAAMGIISCVLAIFNYNIRLLAWIEMWGDTAGWIIRIVLIVVGAILFFILGRGEEEEQVES